MSIHHDLDRAAQRVLDTLDCHRLGHLGWQTTRCCERCHDDGWRVILEMMVNERRLAACCAAAWWCRIYRGVEWVVDDESE